MKRILSAILALAMMMTFVACQSGGTDGQNSTTVQNSSTAPAGEPVKLNVWAWDKNFNGAALNIADKLYEGAEINMIEMAKADVLKKLHTILASGTKEDLPDIVLVGDLSAPAYFMSYPGAFYDMTNVINYDDFAKYKHQSVSYEGKSYGVPFDTGVAGMFYRVDYFEEAGYKTEDLQDITWSDYIEMGKKIKEKGHYLTTLNPGDLSLFQIMLQSAGTWYTDAEGKANLTNNEALKECFKVFADLKNSGAVKLISDWSEYAGAINGGEIAATVSGGWLAPTIQSEESQKGKWAIAPVPKLSVQGATNMSSQGGSSWYVLANAENADTAADFLKNTFASKPELYDELLANHGIMGTYLPAANVAAYDVVNEFFNNTKINANFADWLSKVPDVNYGAYSFETQSILVPAVEKYLNGTDIDKCLEEAQAQLTQQIGK